MKWDDWAGSLSVWVAVRSLESSRTKISHFNGFLSFTKLLTSSNTKLLKGQSRDEESLLSLYYQLLASNDIVKSTFSSFTGHKQDLTQWPFPLAIWTCWRRSSSVFCCPPRWCTFIINIRNKWVAWLTAELNYWCYERNDYVLRLIFIAAFCVLHKF